jgi:hypothetical protein
MESGSSSSKTTGIKRPRPKSPAPKPHRPVFAQQKAQTQTFHLRSKWEVTYFTQENRFALKTHHDANSTIIA